MKDLKETKKMQKIKKHMEKYCSYLEIWFFENRNSRLRKTLKSRKPKMTTVYLLEENHPTKFGWVALKPGL